MRCNLKRILLIGMGGTIASQETKDGLSPELDAGDLLSYVPKISSLCEIHCLNLCSLDSTNLTPAHWVMLARAIKEHYYNYDGFVVSHGTDTMAYTSAALSYLVQGPKPIIITGAQKPIHFDYTDSKINLLDSFISATSESIHGVNIVFNGKIILGTRARKTHSKSFYAFSSINYPIVGVIQDSHLMQYFKTPVKEEVEFYTKLDSSVGLLKMIPGTDPMLLRYLFEHNKILIIESFGVGGLPEYEGADFKQIVSEYIDRGKMLIMTSQVENEGSDLGVYHVGKSLTQNSHVLEAYDMTLEAALAKSMWLLPIAKDAEDFARLFYLPVASDILYGY